MREKYQRCAFFAGLEFKTRQIQAHIMVHIRIKHLVLPVVLHFHLHYSQEQNGNPIVWVFPFKIWNPSLLQGRQTPR
jgi:hypothetical protein